MSELTERIHRAQILAGENAVIEHLKELGLSPIPEFEPCPFCGNTEIRVFENQSHYWNIQCNNDKCGAMIYDCFTEQDAKDSWNKRGG